MTIDTPKSAFEKVSLLITHYNRSRSLANLLERFSQLQIHFAEIIVSDDGSKETQQQELQLLQQKYKFRLITTPVNKGLANNINKGQDAVKTPYTLYIQEDFIPSDIFPEKLATSFAILEERPEIDIARYWAYWKYPYLTPIRNGFSEMKFHILKAGYAKFYVYSDACHLRRSNFLQKFGRYPEGGIKSDKAEYLMMMSFLHKKGRAIYYDKFNELFAHQNSSDEPSTVSRNYLSSTENIVVANIRNLYRHLKFNVDYLFPRN
jgi:glycosyltransferase involved in cell wall biosynthesis